MAVVFLVVVFVPDSVIVSMFILACVRGNGPHPMALTPAPSPRIGRGSVRERVRTFYSPPQELGEGLGVGAAQSIIFIIDVSLSLNHRHPDQFP
ncbi:hypothetical protein NITHO_130004 [Nitrolancea hollandica Lb]|uniref:Uncharacterized protein n=1 Tax=Nitrolancea hollandica Lb TaxID=1129897 RepID=I4ED03_9BACT|nr:hypothetical protein NITHO_130004 [Nitrolancea hollandica Lb]